MRTWTEWRAYFEHNAQRPFPAVGGFTPMSPALVTSLQKFQLGETGEGRIARQIDHLRSAAIDDDYRASLKLFVREEGRHARILATMLREAGHQTLRHSPSASAFTLARRLLGVRFKLVVLLVAEVVAVECYPVLLRAFAEEANAHALAQITTDEQRHLRFHICFFRRALRGYKRVLFAPLFFSITAVAAALCAWDHRHVWRELNVSPVDLARRIMRRARLTHAEL